MATVNLALAGMRRWVRRFDGLRAYSALLEEVPQHAPRAGSAARKCGQAKSSFHQLQNSFVVVHGRTRIGPVSQQRADDHGSYLTAAVRGRQRAGPTRIRVFIERNDQQPVLLEKLDRDQRSHIRLKPVVGCRERAVVRVVAVVGNNQQRLRQTG